MSDNVVVVGDSFAPADVPEVVRHLRRMARARNGVGIVCDVGPLRSADLVTVDALAQLALAARRLGQRFRLTNATLELRDLLALAGLEAVLPCAPDLVVEPRRKTEEREEARRVEEERDPADPAA